MTWQRFLAARRRRRRRRRRPNGLADSRPTTTASITPFFTFKTRALFAMFKLDNGGAALKIADAEWRLLARRSSFVLFRVFFYFIYCATRFKCARANLNLNERRQAGTSRTKWPRCRSARFRIPTLDFKFPSGAWHADGAKFHSGVTPLIKRQSCVMGSAAPNSQAPNKNPTDINSHRPTDGTRL